MGDWVLEKRIEILRRELECMVENRVSLQDPRVMEISMQLDRVIAQYLRQQQNEEYEEDTDHNVSRYGSY
jgi:hypothetical protein